MITRIVIAAAAGTSLAGIFLLVMLAMQRSPTGTFLALMLFGVGRMSRISLAIHGER